MPTRIEELKKKKAAQCEMLVRMYKNRKCTDRCEKHFENSFAVLNKVDHS